MFSASNFLIGPIIQVTSPVKLRACPVLTSRSLCSKATVTKLNCSSTLLHQTANVSILDLADVGSVHVAFTVDNLDAVLSAIAASGWKAAGKPQTLKSGPNAGKRVVYVRDPDGATIEFMQPPSGK